VESETCRKEMYGIPAGVGVRPYVRAVEDALMVLDGNLIVGWEENGERVELELGPRDLVLNPAGRRHWFRNAGIGPCTAWCVVGNAEPESVKFEAA
jgi:mannose-6-phosphate isomerase-like protein (cupin superfamily)